MEDCAGVSWDEVASAGSAVSLAESDSLVAAASGAEVSSVVDVAGVADVSGAAEGSDASLVDAGDSLELVPLASVGDSESEGSSPRAEDNAACASC